MSKFIEIRTKIQDIMAMIWPWLIFPIKFVSALIVFSKINDIFGGNIEIISRSYVPLLLSAVCLFVNFATIGVLALFYLVMQTLAISWILALVCLILGAFLLGACLYFNRRTAGLFWIMPVLSNMGLPLAAPMACGMFCPVTSCGGIAVGTLVTYFLKAVVGYLPNLADEESTVSALDILMDQVIANSGFYILLIALVLMTVVTYTVGLIRVQGAKLYALVMGLVVEALVQLAGKLFFNTGVDMGQVTKSSFTVFLIGLVLVFFTSDGNYSRIEKVRFEDDDYIYHVHAIPKAKITKAHKKVTNVTRDTAKMDMTSNLGAVVEVGGKKKSASKQPKPSGSRSSSGGGKKRPGSSSGKKPSQKGSIVDKIWSGGSKAGSGKKKPSPQKREERPDWAIPDRTPRAAEQDDIFPSETLINYGADAPRDTQNINTDDL